MKLLGALCIWIGVAVLLFCFPDVLPFIGFVAMLATGCYATGKLCAGQSGTHSVTIPLLEVLCVWIGVVVLLCSGILGFIGFCGLIVAGMAATTKLYHSADKMPSSPTPSISAGD